MPRVQQTCPDLQGILSMLGLFAQAANALFAGATVGVNAAQTHLGTVDPAATRTIRALLGDGAGAGGAANGGTAVPSATLDRLLRPIVLAELKASQAALRNARELGGAPPTAATVAQMAAQLAIASTALSSARALAATALTAEARASVDRHADPLLARGVALLRQLESHLATVSA